MSIKQQVDTFRHGFTNRNKSKLDRLGKKCKKVEISGAKIELSREMSQTKMGTYKVPIFISIWR